MELQNSVRGDINKSFNIATKETRQSLINDVEAKILKQGKNKERDPKQLF